MKRFLTHQATWAIMAFLALVCTSIPAHAVGPTGKIVATVTDPTGAPIAGAKVTVINEGTGENRAAISDDSGNVTFPILAVGNYTFKVEATGFQGYLQKGIVLQVDQNISVLAHLKVGSNTEVVQVTGDTGQAVDLVDATLSQVIDEQRVVDLPLNGRDTLQLQYIMPGVSYDNNGVAHGQGQHEGVVVNGNRPASNYYLLDGVDMTDAYLSTAPVFPAPDALQEFDIQTSNFTAQYGRSSGGLINAASKAGTNRFHGGVFEFLRNTVLDSHNYFDPAGLAKPTLKLNQYGGYAGGPIQKNKTFFFGYYQGTKQRKDETVTIGQVLTAAENPALTSDGSAQFPTGTIIDPTTGLPFASDGLIPANRVDPVAKKMIAALLKYTPNTSSGGYTYHTPEADNEDSLNENQYLGRVDHNFGTRDMVFGRYFFNQDLSTGIGAGNMNLPHDKYFRNQNVVLDWNHTFTPRLINTAVMGFTRVAHHRGTMSSTGWGTFGSMPGSEGAGIPSEFYTNIAGGANNGGDGTFIQNRQTWQYTDFLSYVRGKHSISFGGDYRREAVNRIEDYYTDPIFNFSGQYSDPNVKEGGNSTTALADLILGLPDYFNLQTEVRSDLRHTAMDAYVQDNYKVNRHLTIDAGFRWEPFLPPVDNLNDQICFDPTFTSHSAFYPTAPHGLTFPGPPLSMKANGSGDPGCPRAMVPNRMKNVSPRLGINYDPFGTGKTSIRAAYGIFWDQARLIAWNRYSTAQPFDENFEISGAIPSANVPTQGALTGYNIININTGVINPFPFIIPRTADQRKNFSPSYAYGGNAYWPTSAEGTVLPPNFNEGYAGQWNLSVDQEIAKNWVLTVSYIGNHGTHLFMSRDINWAPITTYDPTLTLGQNQGTINTRRLHAYDTTKDWCGINQTTHLENPCLGQTQEEANLGWSNYDAIDFTVNHRFSNGFSLMASYVFGKYLDIVSYGAEGGLGPRDPLNFRSNYGPSDNDVRNRVTSSYIYQLPKLKDAHGLLAAVINDWQNQGVLIAQTGSPYTVYSNGDTGATGIGGDFADRVSGVSTSPAHRGVASYFNPAAFTQAKAGTYGTASRGSLYGPSRVNMDFSLFKEFPIHELGKVQFRSEFFNLFNHPNFSNPSNNVANGNEGALTSASDGRVAQFALKLLF